DSFYYLFPFDDEIECLLALVILFSAYVRLRNSSSLSPFSRYKTVPISVDFYVKYITLYFIFVKCVLWEAVGSHDQIRKTFKTFLFSTRIKKQKNLPSATSAKGVALVPV